ncbi:uncharacterized protein [Dysidea avara]|uniref:uncharacterized protein isoform X2 n=1 Tax=Dysidea avara TaxID=196820 RepID=UPI00332FA742
MITVKKLSNNDDGIADNLMNPASALTVGDDTEDQSDCSGKDINVMIDNEDDPPADKKDASEVVVEDIIQCMETNEHGDSDPEDVPTRKLLVDDNLAGKIDHNANKKFSGHSNSKNPWGGFYCCVPDCKNTTGRNKDRVKAGLPKISFHCFPDISSAKGKMWINKIRRDPGSDFVVNKYTKICSKHFKPHDFVFADLPLEGGRPRLKHDAIPSIFPWSQTNQRVSLTSQKALQPPDIDMHMKQIKLLNKDKEDEIFNDGMEPFGDPDPSISDLRKEILELKLKLSETQNKLDRALFRLENVKDDDGLVKFYTGFSDYETLMAFYEELLESDASVMRQWNGKRSKCDYDEVKVGPACKLPLVEQFFLTLVRIRRGFPELDCAVRFGISQSSVSRVTNTWINLMYHNLKSIETFPSWHIVKKYMPDSFKKDYPNTRIIIDATEFYIERPSSLLSQACTFSSYKNRNTVKVLIGVTPSGAISFVSEAYEGSISDRKLVALSGIIEKLEPGDEIMADKGFTIEDLLIPYGIRLNMPPFLQSNAQMAANDVFLTKKIASLRVHVERAIGRVKEFRILQGNIPASMWDSVSNLIYVCCMLSNFGPPLVC